MKITKYEQSGFIIGSVQNHRLALDIGGYTPEAALKSIGKVEVAVVSHIHPDHFNVDALRSLNADDTYLNRQTMDALAQEITELTVTQIAPGQTQQSGPFSIISFEVDHGPNATQPLIENQGFLINVDGKRIYFAGDMYYMSGLPPETLEVDIALIPIGGHYTFGPQEALDFAKRFNNIDLLVPIHYEMNPQAVNEFMNLANGVMAVRKLNAADDLEL